MIALAVSLLLVLLLDQALKFFALRGLAAASVPLGPFGRLEVVKASVWLARSGVRQNLAMIWSVWCFAAAGLAVLSIWVPSSAWCVGVLLGGSLSHALETSFRGCVIDYVCLSFWPAFNLADLAITVGTVGILIQMVVVMKAVWS